MEGRCDRQQAVSRAAVARPGVDARVAAPRAELAVPAALRRTPCLPPTPALPRSTIAGAIL